MKFLYSNCQNNFDLKKNIILKPCKTISRMSYIHSAGHCSKTISVQYPYITVYKCEVPFCVYYSYKKITIIIVI